MSPQHSEALGKCQYVVSERRGLAVLTGEVGMGKSTIARRLSELMNAQGDINVAFYMFTPAIRSENAFLEAIMEELEVPVRRSLVKSLASFQDYLIDQYANGKTVVLVIDEAQYLSPKMLKLVHTLLNFESNTEKFIQVVLVGQNELAANIDKIRQIKSRVSIFGELVPLLYDDACDMIAFRWQTASGAKSEHPFSEKALEAIYMLSGGLPREIVKLCNESMQIAYDQYAPLATARQRDQEVTAAMVIEAGRDLRLEHKELNNG